MSEEGRRGGWASVLVGAIFLWDRRHVRVEVIKRRDSRTKTDGVGSEEEDKSSCSHGHLLGGAVMCIRRTYRLKLGPNLIELPQLFTH